MNSPNEISLQVYMKKLTKIYNATLNQFEHDKNDELAHETGPTAILSNAEAFRQCKEKAFDYLIRAQNCNNLIGQSERSDTRVSDRNVEELLGKYQLDRQNKLNDLISLHKEYELNVSLVKQQNSPELTSLFRELNGYLKSMLHELISNENSFLNAESYAGKQGNGNNALVYGPSGVGKMSSIVDLLTRKRSTVMCEYLKIFVIDFALLLATSSQKMTEISRIADLMKSINLIVNKKSIGTLIILKNVELLFEEEDDGNESVAKSRFICDLLYELNENDDGTHGSSSRMLASSTRRNIRVFIMISQRPWLLHPVILYK